MKLLCVVSALFCHVIITRLADAARVNAGPAVSPSFSPIIDINAVSERTMACCAGVMPAEKQPYCNYTLIYAAYGIPRKSAKRVYDGVYPHQTNVTYDGLTFPPEFSAKELAIFIGCMSARKDVTLCCANSDDAVNYGMCGTLCNGLNINVEHAEMGCWRYSFVGIVKCYFASYYSPIAQLSAA